MECVVEVFMDKCRCTSTSTALSLDCFLIHYHLCGGSKVKSQRGSDLFSGISQVNKGQKQINKHDQVSAVRVMISDFNNNSITWGGIKEW